MDPEYNLQDVVRCHLCEIPSPSMYCDICNMHICKVCAGEHLSDPSKEHKVVLFEKRGSNPKCSIHSQKLCELHCKQCDIPICSLCVSSDKHLGHKQVDSVLKIIETTKQKLQKDLQELEESIYPEYLEIASNIPAQKAAQHENTQTLTTAFNKHGQDLHREIDIMIKKLKSDLNEMDSKHSDVLNKQEEEVTRIIPEISRSIADLKKLLESNDNSLLSAYRSRNAEFRRLTPERTISLPNFRPQNLNKEQLHQQFGYLSALSIESEVDTYTKDFPDTEFKPLIGEPFVISTIKTRFGGSNGLENLVCLREKEIWISGLDSIVELYNVHGKLTKSITTPSGRPPFNLAVTKSGDLVYTDYDDRTVYVVRNMHIETLIKLRGWKPRALCSTSSDDLLVIMDDDNGKHTTIIRYSGSTKKQSIEYDDKGQPLYSSGRECMKYMSENRNLDVCVSDCYAHAIVVVNQAGKLRFIYTGTSSLLKKLFNPGGITTDSQSQILISDRDNNLIHIINQDWELLRYINNCDLKSPFGLCVDTRDNLFVSEFYNGTLKKIQYIN